MAAGLVSLVSRLRHPLPEVPLTERSPVGSQPGVFARFRHHHGTGTCAFSGCDKQQGWICAYMERSGARCGLRFCEDHTTMINSKPYCPRHTSVVKALAATNGSIHEVKRPPAINDRAVPLLALITDDVGGRLTSLLRELYEDRPDVQVAARRSVQEVHVDFDRVAWQKSWTAYTSAGFEAIISLRVGITEPPVVQALVGDHMVFQGTPDWIVRRRRGEAQDSRDRPNFAGRLVGSVQTQLEQQAEGMLVGAR
jgi:hypothetical protein